MSNKYLVDTIYNYLKFHNFSKEEFCRICRLDYDIFEKVINNELYISLPDYKKLAFVLNLDVLDIM